MNDKDAKNLNEAQQHLAMARVVLNRLSQNGKAEVEKRIGANLEDIIKTIMEYGDKLGDAHTDWSRGE